MLPDCLDLRGANLRIVADQWHGESNSGGSDDSVRQVGHLVTRYTSQSIGDCAVEWNQRTRTRRIIQRLNKCFPHDSRQAMFLDQIGELNETDRRNENGIAAAVALSRASAALTGDHPPGTTRWCGYRLQCRASDVFPGEVLPHLALVLVDFLSGERDPQASPQTSHTLERRFLGALSPETLGMVVDFPLFLRRERLDLFQNGLFKRHLARLNFIIRLVGGLRKC